MIQRLLFASAIWLAASVSLCTPLRTPRPLVIWHGLGDSHSSPGMLSFIELVKETHPGIFVHSVFMEHDLAKDRKAGWFGNVNDQVELASQQIAGIEELSEGFDAIGFSQGGQFLRAYVERYNNPPIHNLITFGSQHMGVSDLPGCNAGDWTCELARRAARGAVYGRWAQENIVQAQYYRDPNRLEQYLGANSFLVDINGEVKSSRNETYRDNFVTLDNLVLVLFAQDKTVVPKWSSWFGSEAPASDAKDELSYEDSAQVPFGHDNARPTSALTKTIIPMRLQPLYTEDWIGLRTLDQRGAVHLETCEGTHMQVDRPCWEPLVKKYVGELAV